MYLVDTDVISELRKREKANRGVVAFFDEVARSDAPLYLAAVTIGELRRGVDLIRHRGDGRQAALLESWLGKLLVDVRKLAFQYGRHRLVAQRGAAGIQIQLALAELRCVGL